EWIAEQLSDLTADQRDVVVLRLIDDLSVRDVAEILDKPEEAVRSLQYRAIRQLRKKLVGDPPRPPRSVR
ncbi:MAG: sigma-70 family RNA polymerase sigma factor, partial [Acidimicrobiia bacterium]|nr:sigma-70 family RNA polymerase sigma factor [Acidimicrobiia bacterium]